MITKPLATLTESDLRLLITEQVPESKQIEYKRELPEGGEKGTVAFLRAITAFANTQGGHLIYGMNAEEGIPVELNPIKMTSSDQVLQRFENLCRDSVQPRLTGVQYQFIPLENGGSALVVRIAKSWNAPHRVSVGNHVHFYGRNAAGAYQLDVAELRQAFTLSDTVVERIRSFRANRLLALGSNEAPVPLKDGAQVVLHVIPLQAMTSDYRVDIASDSQALRNLNPLGATDWSHRINLDGRLNFRNISKGKSYGYTQLFRNGIIETVEVPSSWSDAKRIVSTEADQLIQRIRDQSSWSDAKRISSAAYEKNIIQALKSYFPALNDLGISTPAYVFLSFLGVKDYTFVVNRRIFSDPSPQADRDNILLPEITIEQWSDSPERVMRPAFDMVWNAFGLARSFNYNEAGEWVGQR